MKKRRLVLVLSTLFNVRGGIPRFNQMLCLALDQLAEQLDLDVDVLSQDDGPDDYRNSGTTWKSLRFVAGGGQLSLAIKAFRLCATTRPDMMIVGLLGMTPVGLACLPFLRGGFGFIAHGTESWNEPRRSRRFAARRARFALAVSADTRRALAATVGMPEASIRVFPNTLEPRFERPGETDLPEERGLELLSVSRLWAEEGRKGVDHALRAFARVAPRHPRALYRIVGKGTDKPRLVRLAAELGLGDRVEFLEDVSDEALADLYRDCSLFVLPSGQEGFGIVFLEAMRFAKPCIGGNAGGTPEVIDHGRTGYLVPFGDVDALERALDGLLSDPAARRELGRAGQRRLRERFSFDSYRERLKRNLCDLLPVRPDTARRHGGRAPGAGRP